MSFSIQEAELMQSLMSMVDPETERATYNRGISESSDPGGLSSSRTSCELGPGGGGFIRGSLNR